MLGKTAVAKYILLGIFSGFCSFLFINSATRVIGLIMTGTFTSISKEYIVIFASIILLFIWVRRTLAITIINLSQNLFWKLRKEILSSVLKANYQQLSANKTNVHTAILSDVNTLIDVSLSVIDFFTATILAISCLVYLSSISIVLFSITFAIALIGMTVYYLSSNKNAQQFQKARNLENNFQKHFVSILDGFKEIYMEPRKGNYLYNNKISAISNESLTNNIKAFTGFLNNQITGQVLFYVLIAAVLLIFSVVLSIRPADTVSFSFTLLYLLGAIETIMSLLPGIARAKVASAHLMKLKKELEDANYDHITYGEAISREDFLNIYIKRLEFNYGDQEKSFGIGPIDFDMHKGDVVFIYGGNGSGKTTFIHTLLGLSLPSAGEIFLNNNLVSRSNYSTYRSAFAVVFSDFYLFDELIGIENADLSRWAYYLSIFELTEKVKLEGNSFSTTDLSTGQRKRLALIAALLENKPILVIDEWAADQDPYFRKKFYTEIIPVLKNEGISIIAITHDDKYYYCADRLFKMDYGKLIDETVEIGNTVLSH